MSKSRKIEPGNMDKQIHDQQILMELELPNNGDGLCLFKLEQVVCNHGFFMMAPNRWMPQTNTLHRPLSLLDGTSSSSVMISISHSNKNSLAIRVYNSTNHHLSDDDKRAILVQVKRMLRLSSKEETAVKEFQALHPKALETGFGRLFRAPTLFEDVVKCILLCNTVFSRSLKMARRLCKLQHLVSRGKFECSTDLDKEGMEMGNFPNAQEVVRIGAKMLTTICKLGYRGNTIFQFAKRVTEGKLNLDDEEKEGFQDYLWRNLMEIRGVGPFVCESVMMCIGAYNVVPCDSETLRHLREVHRKRHCPNLKAAKKIIREIYEPYKPFQCLAFWLEMVESYEGVFGKLSELPESEYGNVGGNAIEKRASERDDGQAIKEVHTKQKNKNHTKIIKNKKFKEVQY